MVQTFKISRFRLGTSMGLEDRRVVIKLFFDGQEVVRKLQNVRTVSSNSRISELVVLRRIFL